MNKPYRKYVSTIKISYFKAIRVTLFLMMSCCGDKVNAGVAFPRFVDDAISLNLLQEKDATTLFQLVQKNRHYLRRWLPWVDNIQQRMDQETFIRTENQRWEENKALTLGVWYRKKLVGVVCFHAFDWQHRTTGIGYWLDEAHQGKGIVTKACKALIDIGFQQLGLSTLAISCATENYKSQAIPIRLGFVWQQTITNKEWLYDHYVDHHIYLLSRPLITLPDASKPPTLS